MREGGREGAREGKRMCASESDRESSLSSGALLPAVVSRVTGGAIPDGRILSRCDTVSHSETPSMVSSVESATKKRRFGEMESNSTGVWEVKGEAQAGGSGACPVNSSDPAPGTLQDSAKVDVGGQVAAMDGGEGQEDGKGQGDGDAPTESGTCGQRSKDDASLSHEHLEDDASLKEDVQSFVEGLVEQDGQDKTWEQVNLRFARLAIRAASHH